MARRYSPDELDALLHESQRDATRPTPVTLGSIGAQMAQAGIAALGAAALVGGGLWLLGAPDAVLVQGPLLAGLLTLGGGLVIRVVPADKAAQFRRIQAVQRMVVDAEFRKRQAYAAIERLEAEHADAISEWQRAVNELRQENKALRSDVLRYQNERRTQTFVTRSAVAGETVKDATTILEHWFATLRTDARGVTRGEWLSRPKAMNSGWSKSRHEGAAQLLLDAGVTGINEKLPFVKPEFGDLSAALYRLHTYARQAATEPDMPRRDTYVEME